MESFIRKQRFEKKFFKKSPIKPGLYKTPNAMGCFLFANYHFQMGVIVMGFAEHFGCSFCDLKQRVYQKLLSIATKPQLNVHYTFDVKEYPWKLQFGFIPLKSKKQLTPK